MITTPRLFFLSALVSVSSWPLDSHADNAGTSVRPSASIGLATGGRKVPLLAHYYTWYSTGFGPSGVWSHWGKDKPGLLAPKGTDPTRVWFEEGLRDIASSAYPLIGPYESANREVVRWHIRLAKAARIDAFLVDWWGPGGWQNPPALTYDAFLNAVLPVAEEEGFKICLFDELPQFHQDFDQVTEWAAEYLDRFRRSPAYLHIEGEPVYAIYQLWEGRMTPDDCRRMINRVEAKVGGVYWIVDKMRCRLCEGMPNNRELFFPDEWLAVKEIDALMGYSTFANIRVHEYADLRILFSRLVQQAHQHGKKALLPLHPGHNNSKFNDDPYVMPRNSGETFRGYIRASLEAGADMVAVTSFNEWPETTIIEPSLTWPDPYLYLKILAEHSGSEWALPPLPPLEVLDPLIRTHLSQPAPMLDNG